MSYSSWTPMSHDDYEALNGFDVFTSDNEKLGTIKEVLHPERATTTASTTPIAGIGGHYFRIEPGTLKKLFTDQDEVFVSETMIRAVDHDEDKVILDVRKDSIQTTDWSRPADFQNVRRH